MPKKLRGGYFSLARCCMIPGKKENLFGSVPWANRCNLKSCRTFGRTILVSSGGLKKNIDEKPWLQSTLFSRKTPTKNRHLCIDQTERLSSKSCKGYFMTHSELLRRKWITNKLCFRFFQRLVACGSHKFEWDLKALNFSHLATFFSKKFHVTEKSPRWFSRCFQLKNSVCRV